MNEKYLPLGSIVKLKGATHLVSIIGFCIVIKNENNRQYDYVGVPYPEGFMGDTSMMYFNHNIIGDIISVGFSNEDEKAFKVRLKNTVQMLAKDGDTNYVDNSKMEDLLKKKGEEHE